MPTPPITPPRVPNREPAFVPSWSPLVPAQITWQDNQPYTAQFDDIYYSADALGEVQRVFMAPAQITERLVKQPMLCIGELGFGTGLNFVACAQQALATPNAQLHFISIEKHPLRQTDVSRVAQVHKQALPFFEEFAQQPLPVIPGWHRRAFADGRILLSVFHGDVTIGLADLAERQTNPVDAWFMDGFTPGRHPAMWSEEVCASMAKLSAPGTTVSTFTIAGMVRRNLSAVGFDMRRVDQLPFKRESLAGAFSSTSTEDHTHRVRKPNPITPIHIHGAGIGGACMARHFAERGISVQVYDPVGPASGGSSINSTVVHARLLGDRSANAVLRSDAFHYASNFYSRFTGFETTGTLQLQGANLNAAKLQRISDAYHAESDVQHYWLQHLPADEAAQLCGAACSEAALYFPTAGIANLPELCRDLLDHDNIEFIQSEGPKLSVAQTTIICSGSAARQHVELATLEMVDVFGQLDQLQSDHVVGLPIVGNGYLVPTADGCHIGATYEHKQWDHQQATDHNLALNQHLLGQCSHKWISRQRAPRAITSDRTPVIGQVQDNLWIATGFGSMGTTAAPFAAAIISSILTGMIAPVSAQVLDILRPQRFAERQARRGVRHQPPK